MNGSVQEQSFWESQIRAHSARLYRLALSILREPEAAADACQEALSRAWSKRSQLREREAVGAWMARAVSNECYMHLRRVSRRNEVAVTTEAVDPGCTPQERTDMAADLERALEELPEKTRKVVVLRVVHGYSGNEVKDLLGVSASEISRRLHHGLNTMRGLLTTERSDEGDAS